MSPRWADHKPSKEKYGVARGGRALFGILWREVGQQGRNRHVVIVEDRRVNKAQLIEALTERLGDKKTAGAAVDGLVDVIVRTVNKGEKVNITGFGVFEKRARAARTARNPRTGETVKVKKTNVPAFRPGTGFKDVVSGAKKLPKVAATKSTTARSAGTTTRAAAAKTT